MSNQTLGNPPLALTLAQVKFNAIPTMENYHKEIQNEFRKQLEYIFHSAEDSSIIKVSPQKTEVEKSQLWSSTSADQITRLILGNDALTIETTQYPGYENFVPNFTKALDIVKEITQASHVSRIGFRYINRIESRSDRNLDYYLKPQLLGFQFDDIDLLSSYSRTEAIAQTEEGVLRVHCMQFNSEKDQSRNPLLPPDIVTKLNVKPISTPEKHKYAFLDIDHFKEMSVEPIKFSFPDVLDRLDNLHQGGYNAFISGITNDALKEWK